MIPVIRETYRCTYHTSNGYKPTYTKISEVYLRDQTIFGILTNQNLGYIPPITLCKVTSDPFIHDVETFFFEPVKNDNAATCTHIPERLDHLRNLEFYPMS
jgi:hypothetical protein